MRAALAGAPEKAKVMLPARLRLADARAAEVNATVSSSIHLASTRKAPRARSEAPARARHESARPVSPGNNEAEGQQGEGGMSPAGLSMRRSSGPYSGLGAFEKNKSFFRMEALAKRLRMSDVVAKVLDAVSLRDALENDGE